MSAGPQPLSGWAHDQNMLGELLHSLSQPLTSLRCSLELSIEEVAGRQQDTVSAALKQTDRVIDMVRLMQEYLDTEPATPQQQPVPLGPVLQSVVEQLSSVAAARQVGLQLTGACSVKIALAEPRLRLALQYLIGILIEKQPPDGGVRLQFEQGPSESMLRAQGAREVSTTAPATHDPATATLRRVKLAIASRVLESAGASLVFDSDQQSGFVLRIPHQPGPFAPEFFS